ncbi:MAG: hypothetical protein JOZ96_13605 [Acidobacteria bacterium]|nr:hypothetical protein [Acidobacteriota bacterium]
MPREVSDGEGVTWTCAQAYGGLSEGDENAEAARVEGDLFEVVCTPSGGAQTVRLKLEGGWGDNLSDEELLKKIEAARRAG